MQKKPTLTPESHIAIMKMCYNLKPSTPPNIPPTASNQIFTVFLLHFFFIWKTSGTQYEYSAGLGLRAGIWLLEMVVEFTRTICSVKHSLLLFFITSFNRMYHFYLFLLLTRYGEWHGVGNNLVKVSQFIFFQTVFFLVHQLTTESWHFPTLTFVINVRQYVS